MIPNRLFLYRFLVPFAALSLLQLTPAAHAASPYLSVLWAPTYTMTSSNVSTAPTGGFSPMGGGGALGLMFGSKVGLEAQGFYITRYLNSSNSNSAVSSALLLRVMPVRWLGIGVGGYLDSILSGQSISIGGSRVNSLDYGLKAGGGLHIPVGAKISFLIEAYYKMGIGNMTSTVGSDFKYNMLMGQVGFEIHSAAK